MLLMLFSRNIDLTKLRLIYDGQLTLNLGGENRRVKNIELYVLLLEDCVMFLQVSTTTTLRKSKIENIIKKDPSITCRFHFTEARREISSEVPHRIRRNCSGCQQRRSEEDPQPSYQIQYNDCKLINSLQFYKNLYKITFDDRFGQWRPTSELST